MERRRLLHTVAGGGLLLIAGCVGRGEQETTTTESNADSTATESNGSSSADRSGSHTVSVTKRIESHSGLQRVFKLTDGGRLEYELTCPDGTQKTISGSVAADEWTVFEELVVNLDRDGLQEAYECTSGCPKDIPAKHIEMTVDGSPVSTIIEASATIPTELEEIISKMETFEEALKKPTCE